MNIEFRSPGTEVKQWVINYIKEKIVALHRLHKEIAKAEIYFHEDPGNENAEKICELNITSYGNSFFIRRHADSYESAARIVMDDLTVKIENLVKNQNEPPDEITTTVKV